MLCRGYRHLRAFLILLMVLGGLLIGPVAPAGAAACTVTSTADSGAGTLRQKLADASCSSITFSLPGSAPWTITLANSLPTVTRALTLTGPGISSLTIQGNNTFPLLLIDTHVAAPGAMVTVSDLTLTKGHAVGSYGGNLRGWGANLTLSNVALTNGTAATNLGGAGAYLTSGVIALNGVTVSGNVAGGSAQYGTGAGLFIDEVFGNTDVTITNSEIVGNTSTGFSGGGIAVVRDSGLGSRLLKVTLATSTIGSPTSPNEALTNGGGLYTTSGTVALTGSIISGNAAGFDGGGLYMSTGGTLTLSDTTVSGNAAGGDGGGLALDNNGSAAITATLTGSTISSNSANGGGGGIFLDKTSTGTTSATLGGSTLSGNHAGNGGGLLARSSAVTVTDSTINDNHANIGGGLYRDLGTATLSNVTVSGNTATDRGGGLYNGWGTLTLTNSTISGNSATRGGGLVNEELGIATLSFVTLVGNAATMNGGGVYTVGLGSYTPLTKLGRSIVAGNTSPDGANCWTGSGTLSSEGYNVVGDAAGCPAGGTDITLTGALAVVLDPTLRDNGGPTRTHALAPDSPALDRIPTAQCGIATDQRGSPRPRPAGGLCDIGAVEETAQQLLTVATIGLAPVGRVPAGTGSGPFGYALGTVVTLAPQPASVQTFTRWFVDGVYRGWAPSLTITMDAAHTVQAEFAPTVTFPDVGPGRADYAAIIALASRGTIRGYANGDYGPDDGVQRAQMAALIARATPNGPGLPPTTLAPPACLAGGTWDCEDWGNTFSDQSGLNGGLWRNVGTLQHYGVAFGYDGGACAARGVPSPCYGPTEAVSYAQTITFITRMMKTKGYWLAQPGAPLPYSGVPAPHQEDVRTFAYYTGGVPALPGGVGWNDGATRGWFAMALWAALNSYWGMDGYLPDGRPAGEMVP
ncbi:MAG: choice-of-anchor Q domain-containing protein [Chloroflexia bacterium]